MMMRIKEGIDEGITVTDEYGNLHFDNYNELMITLRYGKDRFDKEYKKTTLICMAGRGSGKTIKSFNEMIDEIHDYYDEELMRTLGYGKDRFDKLIQYSKKGTEMHDDVIDAMRYCYNDVHLTHHYLSSNTNPNEIKNVIFNDPATIVFWGDGTKTIVKCDKDEKFDPEKGLAMAISKKFLGNKGNYYNTFKEWLPEITLETTTIVNTAPTEIKVGAIVMPSIDDMMKDLNTSINDSIKNIRIG